MSRTFDDDTDGLLGRALQAGMREPEARAWRRKLAPLALDTCGCRASAKAAAASGVLGVAMALGITGVAAAVAWGLAAAVAAAIAGKLLGMRAAAGRRARLVGILQSRLGEVAPKHKLDDT